MKYPIKFKQKLEKFVRRICSEETKKLTEETKELKTTLSAVIEENKALKLSLMRLQMSIGQYMPLAQKKSSKVIYTCCTNLYDNVCPPPYVDYGYNYVLFTDNKQLLQKDFLGVWQIRPLVFSELDDTKNQRWHKTHPHVLFPEYDESVWIDANLHILSPYIFQEIQKRQNENIIIPVHFERDCIYDEIEKVNELKKENTENCNRIKDFLIHNSFPKHYGLNETNLIYRHHNDEKIISIMEDWWNFIRDYSKRDQLSLSYVLYKYGILPNKISCQNLRFLTEDFCFAPHLK